MWYAWMATWCSLLLLVLLNADDKTFRTHLVAGHERGCLRLRLPGLLGLCDRCAA